MELFVKTGRRYTLATPDQILTAAQELARDQFVGAHALNSPMDARRFLVTQFAGLEYEVFAVVFVNTRHRVIAVEQMFRGTIDQAAVYPREVVKAALKHNAFAVVLAHNHPSGVAEPSEADIRLTERLVKALALVDIRVLDHIIVAGQSTTSFAERGLT